VSSWLKNHSFRNIALLPSSGKIMILLPFDKSRDSWPYIDDLDGRSSILGRGKGCVSSAYCLLSNVLGRNFQGGKAVGP
jgi:hypothetical protein